MVVRTIYFIQKAYDALAGRYVRAPILSNDIQNVTGIVSSGASTLVCSTIAAANTGLYLYIAKVSCTATPSLFSVMVDSATVALIDQRYDKIGNDLITNPDTNPICKVDAGSTIQIRNVFGTTGTYFAMMTLKRVPNEDKINT